MFINTIPEPSRFHRCLPLIVLMATLPIVGCGKKARKVHYIKPAIIASESDVQEYCRQAREEPSAGARRAAIEQITKTWHADTPLAIETYAEVARRDENDSVRCAAIRALKNHDAETAAQSMIELMNGDSGDDLREPSATVRWEAMAALYELVSADKIPESNEGTLRTVAIARLNGDPSRDVRLTAARVLGHLPHSDSVEALVGALKQIDFGVVYEAEQSLTRLTGQSFEQNPRRWEEWLRATKDPLDAQGPDE